MPEVEETAEVQLKQSTTTAQEPEARSVKTGKWGTCPWNFDSTTGVVTIGAVNADYYYSTPWYSSSGVKKLYSRARSCTCKELLLIFWSQ